MTELINTIELGNNLGVVTFNTLEKHKMYVVYEKKTIFKKIIDKFFDNYNLKGIRKTEELCLELDDGSIIDVEGSENIEVNVDKLNLHLKVNNKNNCFVPDNIDSDINYYFDESKNNYPKYLLNIRRIR